MLTDSDDEGEDPADEWFSLSQDFDGSSLSDEFFSCMEESLAELPPPATLPRRWHTDNNLDFGIKTKMESPIGYEGVFGEHCYGQVPTVLKDELVFGQAGKRCIQDSTKLKSWGLKISEQDQNSRSSGLPFMLWSENENSIWGVCDPKEEALGCDVQNMEPILSYLSNKSISDGEEKAHVNGFRSCLLCQRRYTEGDCVEHQWAAKPKLKGNNQGWECYQIKN